MQMRVLALFTTRRTRGCEQDNEVPIMTEPTMDELIKVLRKEWLKVPSKPKDPLNIARVSLWDRALAIIDDMAHAEVERLKAENAELKAKYEEMDKFADLMWEEHECENNPCPTCAQYDVLVLGGVR